MIDNFLTAVSLVSFMFYGLSCLFSKKMVSEFNRFGLTTFQRRLTGVLQIAGSIGLLLGFFMPYLGFAASLGFSILMFLGFLTRLKIRDSLLETLPSFMYMLLNIYLAIVFYNNMLLPSH